MLGVIYWEKEYEESFWSDGNVLIHDYVVVYMNIMVAWLKKAVALLYVKYTSMEF